MDENKHKNITGISVPVVFMPHNNKIPGVDLESFDHQNEPHTKE